MSEYVFIAFGWLLLSGGVFIAWRWGWRDAGQKTRRCPKCWYDMRATSGIKCPECGHQPKQEKLLFKRRRRIHWIVAGLVLMLAAWPVVRWPLYHELAKRGNGLIAFLPRTVVVLTWPAIRWWETASFETPKAWWAKQDPRSILDLDSMIQSKDLWAWQEWLKQRVAAEALARSESSLVQDSAASHIGYSRHQYPWAVDAVMAAYVSERPPYRVVEVRNNLRAIDPKWIGPVAAAIVRNPREYLTRDASVVHWLGMSGRSMDDIAETVGRSRLDGDSLSQALNCLAEYKISNDKIEWLLPKVSKRRQVSGAALARLAARLGPDGDRWWPLYAMATTHNYVTERIVGCLSIARVGASTENLWELLEAEQGGMHQAGCLAAEMSEAILTNDQPRLSELVEGASAFLHQFRKRDDRAMTSMVLVRFAENGLLPPELAFRALDAASDGDEMDNWWDSMRSLSLLMKLQGANDPRVVELVARRIEAGQLSGRIALDEYAKQGHAPRLIIEAMREWSKQATGYDLERVTQQLREIKEQP